MAPKIVKDLDPVEDVSVVQYQFDPLIIPTSISGRTIHWYIREGLKVCPKVRYILWNDRVRRIKVDGEHIQVDLRGDNHD